MKKLLPLLLVVSFFVSAASAFEIDLPKHYHEDLQKKRDRERAVLWDEIDRSAIEATLRAFIAQNPSVDGVDLSRSAEKLAWYVSPDDGSIKVGEWIVILKEWEYSFPSLKRIKWGQAELFVEIAYDYKTKELGGDGDAFVRLCFRLRRTGALFSKKLIRPELKSSDYGELVVMMPFGGTELQRANKRPETNAGMTPVSPSTPGPAVAHP